MRFVSQLCDLTVRDKDGNLKWDRGVRHVDGKPFTGTLDGTTYENGIPQKS
jgi:hypothetical protein